MSDDVAVVWLGEADARHHDAAAARALAEWARARGVVLRDPISPPSAIASDPTVADRVETELARAREATEADPAERALARADAILREHPEAPAAPFLRAELLRAWSRRAADGASLWQEAEALDGGRLPGIGEKAAPPAKKVPLVVHGAGATVSIDGHSQTNEQSDVGPGEHAVVATKDGRVVYATWLAVRGALEVTLPVATDACSISAFSEVKRSSGRVDAAHVSCGSWIATEPTERGVLVARCANEVCAPFVEWRIERGYASSLSPPVTRDRSQSGIPAWAAWTAVGIGAVTAAAVAIVATGVLEARPVEQRFVVGGARQE